MKTTDFAATFAAFGVEQGEQFRRMLGLDRMHEGARLTAPLVLAMLAVDIAAENVTEEVRPEALKLLMEATQEYIDERFGPPPVLL